MSKRKEVDIRSDDQIEKRLTTKGSLWMMYRKREREREGLENCFQGRFG